MSHKSDPPRPQRPDAPPPGSDHDSGERPAHGEIEGSEVTTPPAAEPAAQMRQGPASPQQNAVVEPSDPSSAGKPLRIAGAVVGVLVVLALIALLL